MFEHSSSFSPRANSLSSLEGELQRPDFSPLRSRAKSLSDLGGDLQRPNESWKPFSEPCISKSRLLFRTGSSLILHAIPQQIRDMVSKAWTPLSKLFLPNSPTLPPNRIVRNLKRAFHKFLALPPEIRERIYDEFICAAKSPVVLPRFSPAVPQKAFPHTPLYDIELPHRRHRRYPPDRCRLGSMHNPAIPLLLLNKKINGEVSDYLCRRRKTKRKVTWELDVLVLHGGVVMTDWLSTPGLTSEFELDILNLNFRIIEETLDPVQIQAQILRNQNHYLSWNHEMVELIDFAGCLVHIGISTRGDVYRGGTRIQIKKLVYNFRKSTRTDISRTGFRGYSIVLSEKIGESLDDYCEPRITLSRPKVDTIELNLDTGETKSWDLAKRWISPNQIE